MAYCYFVLHWLTLSPLRFRMVKLVTGVSKLCITWLSRPSNMVSISDMFLSGKPSDLQSSSVRSLSSCPPSVESITRVVRHFSVQRRAGLEAGGKRLSCTLGHATTSLFALGHYRTVVYGLSSYRTRDSKTVCCLGTTQLLPSYDI